MYLSVDGAGRNHGLRDREHEKARGFKKRSNFGPGSHVTVLGATLTYFSTVVGPPTFRTKCYVPVLPTKMTPHRHTGVVIDYSDKCACYSKVCTAAPTRLSDLRSTLCIHFLFRGPFTEYILSYAKLFSPPQVRRSMPCRYSTPKCWMPAFVTLRTHSRTMTKRACSCMQWSVSL